MSVKIILADDHRIMREGLRALLEKQSGMEVIAEAEDGRTTVDLAHELKPDVVVIDISMPDLNGIDATRQIISASPNIKVIALVNAFRQEICQRDALCRGIRLSAQGFGV